MKKFRFLSLVVALVMILVMFAGCGGRKDVPKEEKPETDHSSKVEQVEENSYDELPEGFNVKKIGSIDHKTVYTSCDGGIYYKGENGKYGIMTFDGKNDTGAKYTECVTKGNYFQVMTVDKDSIIDINSLNSKGVVDVTGKEIVPMKYAVIDVINERFIRACEVTEQTTNKDEVLVYYTDKFISFQASDDDLLFKGIWYVYDAVTGELVEGVSGTTPNQMYGYGNILKYVTEDKENINVNYKGERLPEGAVVFENGYYAFVKDNAGAVYDADHKKIFDYDLEGYVPTDSDGDLFVASQYYNDTTTYVFMDYTGKIVSGEFDEVPYLYGDLVFAGDYVYDLSGNKVVEETYEDIYFDEQLENAWFLRNGDDYTLIKKDGTVLYQGTEDDTLVFDTSYFNINKDVDDKNMYYSFADKDFTLEGNCSVPWLIEVEKPNYIYDVVDSISGKTIINGYSNYSYAAVPGSMIYVYAQKADGGYDIYAVK